MYSSPILILSICIFQTTPLICRMPEGKHQTSAGVVTVVFVSIFTESEFYDKRDVSNGFDLFRYFIDPRINSGSSAAAVYQMKSSDRAANFAFSSSSVLPTDAIAHQRWLPSGSQLCRLPDCYRSLLIHPHFRVCRMTDRSQITQSVLDCQRFANCIS